MFFIIGIFIAFFLVLLLLIKKNKSRADKILVVWLFLLAFHQLLFYFKHTGELYLYPNWLGVEFPLPVLHGVLLFFYTLEITGNTPKNKWWTLVHFIPALSLILFGIPFYILTEEEKVYIYENQGIGFETYSLLSAILISLSGLVYSIWSLILVKKHQIKIQDRFSNTEKKELQWLMYISIGLAIIWIITIFFDGTIVFSAVVILVLFMGFFGINQLNIFYSNTALEKVIDTDFSADVNTQNSKRFSKVNNKSEKYAKSGLSDEMASEIFANLKGVMEDNSFYKNEELTLIDLSKRLEVHPNHLSQVINEMGGKNFYNYINSLRIKEFIKIASLPENKKYTMISLAYDCGFSTKSTFNKHFKLQTGKTPTDFFNA